jgi:hypothetical protein
MFWTHANRSNRSAPPVHHTPNSQSVENQQTESKKMSRWPTVAITATYRYLSEGVRTLGEGYSTYNDRNPQ